MYFSPERAVDRPAPRWHLHGAIPCVAGGAAMIRGVAHPRGVFEPAAPFSRAVPNEELLQDLGAGGPLYAAFHRSFVPLKNPRQMRALICISPTSPVEEPRYVT